MGPAPALSFQEGGMLPAPAPPLPCPLQTWASEVKEQGQRCKCSPNHTDLDTPLERWPFFKHFQGTPAIGPFCPQRRLPGGSLSLLKIHPASVRSWMCTADCDLGEVSSNLQSGPGGHFMQRACLDNCNFQPSVFIIALVPSCPG